MKHKTDWEQLPKTMAIVTALVTLVGCNVLNIDRSQAQQSQQAGASNPASLAETGLVYSLIEASEGTTALRQAAARLQYVAGEDIALASLGMIMVRYQLPEGVTGAQAIAALEAAVPTSTVGVNHAYRLQSNHDGKGVSKTDGRNYANSLLNWPGSACAAQAPVGIIDGRVDAAAPALAGTKLSSRDFGAGSPESLRHGTEMASVLADPSRLSQLTLFSANVISADEDGEDVAGAAAIVQALDWLGEEGVKIVNISLAGPKNKLLKRAVDRAEELEMILVAAAGNLGRNAPPQFPAAFPSVIAVTAVDVNERPFNRAVRGDHIDIAAPGVDIFVPSATGGRYVTGTSVAVPFVTARMAAQSNSSRQTLAAEAVDLGTKGKDPVFGHGLLNANGRCQ